MSTFHELRRRQLDEELEGLSRIRDVQRPAQGWVRTIREALGMSIRQLAERVGVTKSAIAALEDREAEGRITLDSLERAAEALECEVAYFLIPRGRLEEIVRKRAESLAREMVVGVDESMALEMQRTSTERREELVEQLATELLSAESKLWDG